MSYSVIFRPQAQLELLEAREWYETRQEGLGGDFFTAVEATIHDISQEPSVYPRVHNEIRRAILRRFPYAVFQLLQDQVVILAIIHGRRNPRTWQSRR